MKTENAECGCGSVSFLVAAVVFLSLMSLALLSLSIYLYKKSNQVSQKIVRNRSLSFAFGESCKINSFTCLQLKNNKDNIPREPTRLSCPIKPSDKRMVARPVQSRPGHVSNSSSGNFRRFEPRMYKLCSKLSLGRSNTISHSSYNSANEELEFDLYDYGHQYIGEDDKEDILKNNWEVDDFSMLGLVPTKLFPSDDTIVHVNEVKSSSKISSMNESPIPLRKGDYNQNIMESITSDLTSSIMSDLNLTENNTSQEPSRKGQGKSIMETLQTLKQNHTNQNSQDLVVLHINKSGDERTETMLERKHVWANVKKKTVQNTLHTHPSAPPITLIDELELWDTDE